MSTQHETVVIANPGINYNEALERKIRKYFCNDSYGREYSAC